MAAPMLSACVPAVAAAEPPTPCPTPDEASVCQPAELLQDEPEDDGTCQEAGTLERYEISSALLNSPLAVSVYLPPCYDPHQEGGYPVLYLLHGQNFDDHMWVDLGAAELADERIQAGEWPPFLMVFPFEEFFYRKAAGNQYPLAIAEEVVPWLEENFNACAQRDCRALGGISRGASWTLRIGLSQSRLFGALGVHSLPDFLGGPDAVAEWIEGIPRDQLPRVYMDSGNLDASIKTAYRTENVLNEKGVPHTWHMNEGCHDEAYWRAHLPEYLDWYAGLWEQRD